MRAVQLRIALGLVFESSLVLWWIQCRSHGTAASKKKEAANDDPKGAWVEFLPTDARRRRHFRPRHRLHDPTTAALTNLPNQQCSGPRWNVFSRTRSFHSRRGLPFEPLRTSPVRGHRAALCYLVHAALTRMVPRSWLSPVQSRRMSPTPSPPHESFPPGVSGPLLLHLPGVSRGRAGGGCPSPSQGSPTPR